MTSMKLIYPLFPAYPISFVADESDVTRCVPCMCDVIQSHYFPLFVDLTFVCIGACVQLVVIAERLSVYSRLKELPIVEHTN